MPFLGRTLGRGPTKSANDRIKYKEHLQVDMKLEGEKLRLLRLVAATANFIEISNYHSDLFLDCHCIRDANKILFRNR